MYEDVFGKNEQVGKMFWTFFVVMIRVVDLATAQQVVGMIAGV